MSRNNPRKRRRHEAEQDEENENIVRGGASGSLNREVSPKEGGEDAMEQDASIEEPATFPLTDECHHYSRVGEVPWDIQKYWHQRYTTFSRYDEGIHLTDDLWFGVTPEPVASQIAQDLAHRTPAQKTTLLDLFSGASNNTIAFALSGRWSRIIAVESSPSAIACAQHNASTYGVAHLITFVHSDVFSFLSSHLPHPTSTNPTNAGSRTKAFSRSSPITPKTTVIFASPPWGGPGYRTDEVFDVNAMQPYGLAMIHKACKRLDHALYLPRTSDLRQVARCAPNGEKVEVVQMCVQGASKAMVVYVPACRDHTDEGTDDKLPKAGGVETEEAEHRRETP